MRHIYNGILAIQKKKILPFGTWMDLEGIGLSEIVQGKTNTVLYHLYMKSKEAKLIETDSRMVITRAVGWEK